MNRDDRIAIEWECTRLINLYALLTDEARWDEIVALYAEDGLMTRPTAPDDPIVGHDALYAAFTARPPRISRHVCANIVVTAENADEASAQSLILLFTGSAAEDGGLPVPDAAPLVGTYSDRFRLTDKGWRFTERRGELSFRKM
ncbi:nuclear transport factor 2 family protein [Parasphingopyxis marina]|uniref:Nuclear transport factor 2 family protein n=1 Tax=Parasphingopyxis marina TaxID=2761622 RepID=A0A842I2W8_9SPHN|nr:nuclear transport factor 2 family protein [Parasphingopyxis marina]MBC2779129.1 nuclear transport factor 2 family protein [Parasphingopyxis marina]